MANIRVIELEERTTLDTSDFFLVDAQTGTRKLAFSTLLNYLTLSSIVFVTELPTTDIQTNVIYFVPHSGSSTVWDEYVYRDGVWVHIAQSTIDLSAIYQTKTDASLETTSKQIVGAINEVNNDLTANSQKFEAAYQNGKYGFTINNTFYEIGGGGMPTLDYTNYLHVFLSSAPSDLPSGATYGLTFTATKDCYIVGLIGSTASVAFTLKINSRTIVDTTNNRSCMVNLKLTSGDVVTITNATDTLHVFDTK